jgi:hypothetical protein
MYFNIPGCNRKDSLNLEKRLFSSSWPSLCISIRPPAPLLQRGSHWTDFREILYWGLLRKHVEKSKRPSDLGGKKKVCRKFYVKTWVRCIVTGDIRSP